MHQDGTQGRNKYSGHKGNEINIFKCYWIRCRSQLWRCLSMPLLSGLTTFHADMFCNKQEHKFILVPARYIIHRRTTLPYSFAVVQFCGVHYVMFYNTRSLVWLPGKRQPMDLLSKHLLETSFFIGLLCTIYVMCNIITGTRLTTFQSIFHMRFNNSQPVINLYIVTYSATWNRRQNTKYLVMGSMN